MSADLKAARRAFRQAATCLRQSAEVDTLPPHAKQLILAQALAADAEANAVTRRLTDEAEHRAELRRRRS